MDYEMKGGDYENFPDEKDEEDVLQEAETSFTHDNDEDNLYNRDKNISTSRKLPVTQDEKRNFMGKYFHDSIYNDSTSRIFLSNIDIKESDTAHNDLEIFYKGIEIGTVDLDTKTLTRNMDNIRLSGYDKDHKDIINYRNSTLMGQIEETTGDTDHEINKMIKENIKKKFAIEMRKREGLRDPGEHIEMNQLNEDYRRLEIGKKVETELGKEILNEQVEYARRLLEFKKFVGLIPGVGFLFVSVMGIITAIALLGKGVAYDGSKSLQPAKKKKGDDAGFEPIREAQKLASQILESTGDHFELIAGVSTVFFVAYKYRKK